MKIGPSDLQGRVGARRLHSSALPCLHWQNVRARRHRQTSQWTHHGLHRASKCLLRIDDLLSSTCGEADDILSRDFRSMTCPKRSLQIFKCVSFGARESGSHREVHARRCAHPREEGLALEGVGLLCVSVEKERERDTYSVRPLIWQRPKPRSSSTMRRGFGFIVQDDGGSDSSVHRNEIRRDH